MAWAAGTDLCTVVNKAVLSFVSWEDLVVGAPQYFEKEREIGGAVYVYVNNQGMWDKVKPVRIDGPQDSMFGLAVANLGDINQDGYHGEATLFVLLSADPFGGLIMFPFWLSDFAVGAPNCDNGAGKVFIYHGSRTGLQSKKAGQVWSKPVESLPLLGVSSKGISVSLQVLPAMPGVKMFGYSLASNMDLDKNSYPDLAVGSLSDAVFVYR